MGEKVGEGKEGLTKTLNRRRNEVTEVALSNGLGGVLIEKEITMPGQEKLPKELIEFAKEMNQEEDEKNGIDRQKKHDEKVKKFEKALLEGLEKDGFYN